MKYGVSFVYRRICVSVFGVLVACSSVFPLSAQLSVRSFGGGDSYGAYGTLCNGASGPLGTWFYPSQYSHCCGLQIAGGRVGLNSYNECQVVGLVGGYWVSSAGVTNYPSPGWVPTNSGPFQVAAGWTNTGVLCFGSITNGSGAIICGWLWNTVSGAMWGQPGSTVAGMSGLNLPYEIGPGQWVTWTNLPAGNYVWNSNPLVTNSAAYNDSTLLYEFPLDGSGSETNWVATGSGSGTNIPSSVAYIVQTNGSVVAVTSTVPVSVGGIVSQQNASNIVSTLAKIG